MHFQTLLFAADAADAVDPTPGYVLIGAALIVLVGLLGFGFSDLLRFSITRAWAIGGVCFRESIRRRVLWIIPLAAVGVIVVSQLQKVVDERDVIRETTKFCLFATGLVLVMTSIILACTNLPREIETRVIYTVVTKPTTRLELILGKIIGFSRVSALIVIIMGLFTYGYLELRNIRQGQAVYARLQTDPSLGPAERNRLEHFHETGLLTAESYAHPQHMQILANIPRRGESLRSFYGGGEEDVLFQFVPDPHILYADPANADGFDQFGGVCKTGMLIGVRVRFQRIVPEHPDAAGHNRQAALPTIELDIFGRDQYPLVGALIMNDPRAPDVKAAHATALSLPADNVMDGKPISQAETVWAYVPAQQAGLLFQQPYFFVHLGGDATEYQYFVDSTSAVLAVAPALDAGKYAPSLVEVKAVSPNQMVPQYGPPIARGRPNMRGGEELLGKKSTDPHAAFALFHFLASDVPQTGESIPLEISAMVTHTADSDENADLPSEATLSVLPAGADTPQSPTSIVIESKQTIYASLPASSIGSGDFDLVLRCNTPGNVLALNNDSIALVVGSQPFAWNLAKSLFILWLLTVLVVTIAILTSTFVSWPIAVVLTAVLLMGHWCVTQVADTADATLGRSIATDMGLTDPSKAEAVVSSVNALSSGMTMLGKVLPDIDRFAAIDDIQKGAIVTAQTVGDALFVLGCFGLPMAVLAYLVMKKKEVAP
jgi:ABC-type transport system involved in multi-copper enzyme maturation permease subunit